MISIPILLATAAIELGLLIAHLLRRRSRKRPLTAPEQTSTDRPPAPPPPPLPPKRTDADIIAEVASHIAFSRRREPVGWKVVGQRAIGERREERPWPADEIHVRPIHSVDELAQRVDAERTASGTVQTIRVVSGDALVNAYVERVPVTEPIHEPVYAEVRKVVSVLLDVSPSMFGDKWNGWAKPYWRGVTLELLHRARAEGATFLLRCFGGTVGDLVVANSDDTAARTAEYIRTVGEISSTCIALAIHAAIADVARDQYDEADIMIVTDGEDNGGFDPAAVRQALDNAKIRLHAILFGVQNAALRQIADVYQEVPEPGVIKPPVRRLR